MTNCFTSQSHKPSLKTLKNIYMSTAASPPPLETALLLLLLLLLFLLHQLFLQVQSVGSVAPRSRRLIHLNTSSLWTPPVQPCVPELGRWRERREEEGGEGRKRDYSPSPLSPQTPSIYLLRQCSSSKRTAASDMHNKLSMN